MLRQAFTDRLKGAMKARDARTLSTVRLILASLKERDVAVRGEGNCRGHRRARNRPHAAGDDQAAPRIDRALRARQPRRSRPAGARRNRHHRKLSAASDERRRDRGGGASGDRRNRRCSASRTWAGSWRRCASATPARSISAAPVRPSSGCWAECCHGYGRSRPPHRSRALKNWRGSDVSDPVRARRAQALLSMR